MLIAYVGPVPYPSNRADAQRMHGISLALRAAGHTVLIGSGAASAETANQDEKKDVTFLEEIPRGTENRVLRVAKGLLWGRKTMHWLESLNPQPQLIIVYGNHLGYIARLLRLRRKTGIPIVADLTEWYESAHLAGGTFGPASLLQYVSMNHLAPRFNGVIVISRFLEEHFTRMGTPALRVPPLFDVQDAVKNRDTVEKVSICYAGSPGAKDATTIENLLLMPDLLDGLQTPVIIDIVGIDQPQQMSPSDSASPITLRFHGRVDLETAREFVSSASATVLQRPNRRYARAGFPSKTIESLLLGTPVLANPVGEIASCLDESNGIILTDESANALAEGVRQLANGGSTTRPNREIAEAARAKYRPEVWAPLISDFCAVAVRDEYTP